MQRKKKISKRTFSTSWDLTPLFDHDDDPKIEKKRKEIEKKSYEFIGKWKDRRDYLRDPVVLKEALDEYEAWNRHCGTDGDEGFYFMLRTQEDQNSPALKAKFNKIEDFSHRVRNDIQFFHLRVSRIPRKRQRRFLEHEGLKEYRHFLERLFAESRYLLSEPEEKIMNLKSSTSFSNWVRMTSSFLVKEERKVLLEDGRRCHKPFTEISSLINSRNKKVRDSAARAFNEIVEKHADVAEAEINSILANKKTDDELRKLSRPDLSRHLSDDIESGIVDALLTAVSARFSISSQYYRLKANLMGVKQLKYHERNVEYGDIGKRYSYGKSIRLIEKVFRNLDKDFSDILLRFLEKGQIDVYPGKGKANGAFCAHHLISQPTYILLNHTDKLQDVLTIAHELGHGINNELMRRKQNSLNFDSPLSTAEVASTFMEDFVLQELLGEANDELRLVIMMNKLNDDVSTIFRQVACYRFEQELHGLFREKGYLSKEEIGRLFQKRMAGYMGKYVEQSPGSENWWVHWGHIRHFFYVYSYASGLLISKSLQHSVKEDPGFIEKVKEFLSAGLSDSPRRIFAKLGIDIGDSDFWNKGLDEVEKLLEETTALAMKLKKI
ncbi:MAG TPA: M3 family oligoendopeptidase [Thermodesulfovibrionales bacterium]|nr:M3 family oligoendopeptidase [Thermodesulfovibrionales bacterium]